MINLLLSAYNSTTLPILKWCKEDLNITVFRNQKSHLPTPVGVHFINVSYHLSFLERILGFLKIDRVRPEYIKSFKEYVYSAEYNRLIVIDFFNLTFYQFLKYKKKNSRSRLYLWSETRQWPQLWITRLLMYVFWLYFKANLKYVEQVFVFTKQGKEFFNKNAPEVKVEILPAPLDTTIFFPDQSKSYMDNGVLHIIMNARYIPLKEHRTLFTALKALKEKGLQFKLTLIGRSGDIEDELREYSKQSGIGSNLTWLNPVSIDRLRNIYVAHDLLILPSNREAIGMVVPEAMACGLVTITSDAVGANTYVKEGETGLIFKTGSVEDLVTMLEQCFNREKLRKMGEAGAREIRENYSVKALGEKFKQILQ